MRKPRVINHIKHLKPDAKNARRHTPRNIGLIVDALSEVGAARSIVIDEQGRVLAGNGTIEAAAEAGITKIQVVDSDGETLIAVRRRGLTEHQKRRLALFDNRSAEPAEWDAAILGEFEEEGLLDGLFYKDELEEIYAGAEAENLTLDAQDDDGDDQIAASVDGQSPKSDDLPPVPDALFPTDNDWGIPLLDVNYQAEQIDLPALIWGATGRRAKNSGTRLFYTEDYRYTRLWKSPNDVVATGCVNAVEPNFSCYEQMPRAVALWRIYQKRWLGRYWQSRGIRILADLNVATDYCDLNLLGIPDGWRAWATRGYTDRIAQTHAEFEIACRKAGSKDILFVVYGGGSAVKRECQKRGWIWLPEVMDVRKGKESALK